MSDIRSIDIRLLDDAFQMGSGYVLDFSDRTMGRFFLEELNVDIDESRWTHEGTSKAKRLRYFLRTVDNATAARTIKALWDYRKAFCRVSADDTSNVEGRILDLIGRLDGSREAASSTPPAPARNTQIVRKLRQDLIDVWNLAPHDRGRAFETFLTSAFDLYGLKAKGNIVLRGEQIDGSFELDHETYLFEAKWQASPTGAADLHVFEGKLLQKAAWARGLFVSYNGFTQEGLHAFGRAKRAICMSGQDLDEALGRELPLDYVIRSKARKAVETGSPFTSVRDLL